MLIESTFPADYAKTNMSVLAKELDGSACVTLIAPSGTGKSVLLRYLAYNRKYQRKYKNLNRAVFIYLDAIEIVFEVQRITSKASNNLTSEVPSIVEVYENLLAKSVLETLDYLKIDTSKLNLITSSKDLLIESMQLIQDKYPKNNIFLIVDGTEKLLSENLYSLGDILKFLRGKFRNSLNYIFTLERTDQIDFLTNNSQIELSSLMSKKLIVYKLLSLKEMFIPISFAIDTKLPIGVYVRTTSFKNKLMAIDKLTGGYFPYAKLIWANKSYLENLTLTSELVLATKRLLASLTQTQIGVLRKIALRTNIQMDFDLDYLIKIGIVKQEGSKIRLFCPIIEMYFKAGN